MRESSNKFLSPEKLKELDSLLNNFFKRAEERIRRLQIFEPLNLSLSIKDLDSRRSDYLKEVLLQVSDHIKLNSKGRVSEAKLRRALEILFANSVFNPGKLIGYSRDTNSYKRGIYNPKGVGVKILLSLIDALTELKIIDEVHIAPRSNSSSRISSRFKISDKYLEEFISKAKKSPRVDIGPGIFVRDARGCLVDSVKEKATFLNMSKKLARINSTNEDSQYELLGEVLEPPVLKRVFNNSSLKLGGRFYSFGKNLYQSLKKREREKIKINSQDVIEIDFKSLHPNFLYAMKGIQLNRDAYSSLKNDKSLDRKALKKSFLIAINCKNENGAIMAIANDLKISRSESKHIMQEIFKSHQEIRDLFFSTNLALKLQFKDSTLAEMVMLKYIQSTRGGAILPVHDSFIVSQQNSPLLKEIMKESYKTLTGFEIEVE